MAELPDDPTAEIPVGRMRWGPAPRRLEAASTRAWATGQSNARRRTL